jgi:hypothetical protein
MAQKSTKLIIEMNTSNLTGGLQDLLQGSIYLTLKQPVILTHCHM